MFPLAGVTLLIRYLLIKPIHNEIAGKYSRNESLYYEPNRICSIIDLREFNMLTFPAACALIILFALLLKRNSLKKNACHGHLAPPVPFDYFGKIKRKFAAMVFAILAIELYDLIYKAVTIDKPSENTD
ncbi:unnamed protein product, partial [Didymodactylos carnosus]